MTLEEEDRQADVIDGCVELSPVLGQEAGGFRIAQRAVTPARGPFGLDEVGAALARENLIRQAHTMSIETAECPQNDETPESWTGGKSVSGSVLRLVPNAPRGQAPD